MKRLMILNGPNLNLLGVREPHIYGTTTLAQVRENCERHAKQLGLELSFHQSNHEGELVDWIQEAGAKKAIGIVINPAGYTHTSVAIMDALLAVRLPAIELHVTNIHAREDWRNLSYVSKAAKGMICGFGINGYALAIGGLAALTATGSK